MQAEVKRSKHSHVKCFMFSGVHPLLSHKPYRPAEAGQEALAGPEPRAADTNTLHREDSQSVKLGVNSRSQTLKAGGKEAGSGWWNRDLVYGSHRSWTGH